MTDNRPRSPFARIRDLLQGMFTGWVKDREAASPRAVYERAISERTRQYAELKNAVAGILYMRNKLEAEIRERSLELQRLQADIARAVTRSDDDVALALITQKESLVEDLERARKELDEVSSEADNAKGNLVKFRAEIRNLEREKVRMLAQMANARARRRIQAALGDLTIDGEMRALENVREQIARLKAENSIDQEIGDSGLDSRLREIRHETRTEGARRELEELKRRLRPTVLEMPTSREPVARSAN